MRFSRVFCLLTVVAVIFSSTQPADAAQQTHSSAPKLLVSHIVNRQGAVRLRNATIHGKVAIFVQAREDIDEVKFSIDGRHQSTEHEAPFDFNGTESCDKCDPSAIAFNTTTLPDGPHTVTADVRTMDGNVKAVRGEFDVNNAHPRTSLNISTASDRQDARALEGGRLDGEVYIFVLDNHRRHPRQVKFYVDDPGRTQKPFSVEHIPSYDLNRTALDGNAFPFDTRKLPDGSHNVVAEIHGRHRGIELLQASFEVRNGPDREPPTGTIVIDGGAAATKDSKSTLMIDARDNVAATEMHLANGTDASKADWRPFAHTVPWSLLEPDGNKTVAVQFRDAAGNVSNVVTDSIQLDTKGPDLSGLGDQTVKSGSDVTIHVSVSDGTSGVRSVTAALKEEGSRGKGGTRKLRRDNADQNVWTDTIKGVTTSFSYDIIAVDNAGNETRTPVYSVHVTDIIIDQTPPSGSVTIDDGTSVTRSTAAALLINAKDHAGVIEMRVANGTTVEAAQWQPYATSLSWVLPGGDGIKTVSIDFRDAAGNVSPTSTDSILLDTTAPAVVSSSGDMTVASGSKATVRATITDDNGVAGARLFIGSDGSFAPIDMTAVGDVWTAGTPPITSVTRYYVEAADNAGNAALFPGSAPAQTSIITPATPGALAVSATLLPAGVSGAVWVTGPNGFSRNITTSTNLTDLAPGEYDVRADPVRVGTDTYYANIEPSGSVSVASSKTTPVAARYVINTPDTTTVLNGAALESLEPSGAQPTILVFKNDGDAAPDINPGDILNAGVSRTTPYGLLRKVTTVTHQNGNLVVQLTDTSLMEALPRAEFAVDAPLSPGSVGSASSPGSQTQFAASALSSEPRFTAADGGGGNFFVQLGNWSRTSVNCGNRDVDKDSTHASGDLRFGSSLQLKGGWGLVGPYLEFTYTLTESSSLTVSASATIKCKVTQTVLPLPPTTPPLLLNFIDVPIGPVQLIIWPGVQVDVRVTMGVPAEFEITAGQVASATVGVRLDTLGPHPITKFASLPTINIDKAKGNGVDFSTAIGPKVFAGLYIPCSVSLLQGCAFATAPTLYVEHHTTPTDWHGEAGVEAGLGVQFEVVGKRFTYEKPDLFQHSFKEWKKPAPPGGGGGVPSPIPDLAITAKSLPDGQAGKPYTASVQASGGQPPYRWAMEEGGGLSIEERSGIISGTLPDQPGDIVVAPAAYDTTGKYQQFQMKI